KLRTSDCGPSSWPGFILSPHTEQPGGNGRRALNYPRGVTGRSRGRTRMDMVAPASRVLRASTNMRDRSPSRQPETRRPELPDRVKGHDTPSAVRQPLLIGQRKSGRLHWRCSYVLLKGTGCWRKSAELPLRVLTSMSSTRHRYYDCAAGPGEFDPVRQKI